MRGINALAAAVALSACAQLCAQDAVAPAPAAADIKACIKQMDVGNKWVFDWKLLEIGAPRHPRNSYEALYGGHWQIPAICTIR